MMYYEGIDYWVRRVEFPNTASESVVVSHGDGTFTIYINTLFCEERQAERLEHELRHLDEEHFYRDDLSIRQIEHQANGETIKEEPQVKPEAEESEANRTIPLFSSLKALRDYMFSMKDQYQRYHSAANR